ncbi:hypothetical protein ACFVTT_24515 [Streptomyces niveus]|uniref:hypothetical protein n=1 Tax=Streptomyces niveus TaxID=193462 RepID=UPI00343C7E34
MAELCGDVVGEPVPLGLVLVALDDLGGVAQLIGELVQDRGPLLGIGRGVGGLQECVEGGGDRGFVLGEAEEVGVQFLGDAGDRAAAPAVAELDGCLVPGAEADDHVARGGGGVEVGGEGAGEVVRGRGIGRRGGLQADVVKRVIGRAPVTAGRPVGRS